MYMRLVIKIYLAHYVQQLPFRTTFFVFAKVNIPNGSLMDAYRNYDLTVVHLFKCIFNLGPRVVCYRPRAALIRRCHGRLRIPLIERFIVGLPQSMIDNT